MGKVKAEVVDVQLLGGSRNLTFSIKITRPDGSGISFTLTPHAANSLADQLNTLLDDPEDK
jgi:hypothetical protein